MADLNVKRRCRTATGADGYTIRLGDLAVIVSVGPHISYPVFRVVDMWKQGADGTILEGDVAPDSEYPHHRTVRASKCLRVFAVNGVYDAR